MSLTDQYQRIIDGALLCLSDHYTRALQSGAIAFRTNAHNLHPGHSSDTAAAATNISSSSSSSDSNRQPLDFGSIMITETCYIHPVRQTWVHGELHIKASVDFGDNAPFSMEEKIRGSGHEVVAWGRDFRVRLSVWCKGKPGFFRVMHRSVEVEEVEGRVGETRAGF
jgi:hypothetical protein